MNDVIKKTIKLIKFFLIKNFKIKYKIKNLKKKIDFKKIEKLSNISFL